MSVSIYPLGDRPKPELNVANGNFATLWAALGLEIQAWGGEIDGRTLETALNATRAQFGTDLVEKDGQIDGNLVDMGIRPDQAARYFAELEKIAIEAQKRETPVVWA